MGIVISRSAADKLTSYKTEETTFSVNNNDILINLYGDRDRFKSFPHVGDMVDGKILCALRRKSYASEIYSFQSSRLRKIDHDSDSIIYTSGGRVSDIEIYSNVPLEELQKRTDAFSQEIAVQYESQQKFWQELATALEEIIPAVTVSKAESDRLYAEEDARIDKSVARFNMRKYDRNYWRIAHALPAAENPNKYTDEVAYLWKVAHENINDAIKWRDEGREFDNFKLKFTILKENPLVEGCKLTGRLTFCL
jgi:hypothetical protein